MEPIKAGDSTSCSYLLTPFPVAASGLSKIIASRDVGSEDLNHTLPQCVKLGDGPLFSSSTGITLTNSA